MALRNIGAFLGLALPRTEYVYRIGSIAMIVFGFNGKSQESSLRLIVDGDHLRAFVADYVHLSARRRSHLCLASRNIGAFLSLALPRTEYVYRIGSIAINVFGLMA